MHAALQYVGAVAVLLATTCPHEARSQAFAPGTVHSEVHCTVAVRPYLERGVDSAREYLVPGRYVLRPLGSAASATGRADGWALETGGDGASGSVVIAYEVVDASRNEVVLRDTATLTCASSPGTAVVHDRDGDGVPDVADACPDVPGVRDVDPRRNGCPLSASPRATAADQDATATLEHGHVSIDGAHVHLHGGLLIANGGSLTIARGGSLVIDGRAEPDPRRDDVPERAVMSPEAGSEPPPMDPRVTSRVLAPFQRDLHDCYAAAQIRVPSIGGNVSVSVLVGPYGGSIGAASTRGLEEDPALGRCVGGIVRMALASRSVLGEFTHVTVPQTAHFSFHFEPAD